jgi:sugar O-acyltransferase (sialic acid O-acetyltransferase NeuD family)
VLGPLSDGVKFKDAQFILAVGSPRTRQAIAGALDRLGDVRYATLVHPSAGRFDRSSIGEGSIVGWHALLSDKTAVGRHCILNAVTTIGHDSVLGDFCTLASHVSICGNVSIGNGAEVGTGAVVLPGVSLGRGSLCCAGSIVANDVADSAAVAGNPARRFKDLSPFPV